MTKFYDGFIVLDDKTKKKYKFKYIKGISNNKVEDDAIDKIMKAAGTTRARLGVHDFIKKGEWDKNTSEVLESESFLDESKTKYLPTFENFLGESSLNETAADKFTKDQLDDVSSMVYDYLKHKLYIDGANVRELHDPVQTHAIYGAGQSNVDRIKSGLAKMGATKFRVVKNSGIPIICFNAGKMIK